MDVREPLRRQPGAVVHLVNGEGVGRDLQGQRQSGDAIEDLQVGVVRRLLMARTVHAVVDQHRPKANPLPRLARRGVGQRLERPRQVVLGQLRGAVRTGEGGSRAAGGGVERLVEEHDFAGAVRAREDLAPHRVVDAPGAPPVSVARLVHPADLRLDLLQQPTRGPVERIDVERDVVVGGDERGRRRQVAQDHAPGAPRRRGAPLRLPALFQCPAIGGRRRAAPLRGDAGHARPAEAVENHVAGPRVVEDGRDDRQVRHLGVVAVRPVEGVGLAGADVDGERLAVIGLVGVVRPAVALDELGQERVGTRGVVRRVGQPQDVLVVRHGEVGPLPQLGQLLLQPGAEVLAARLVRLEGQPEALDGSRAGRRGERGGQLRCSVIRGRHGRSPCRRTMRPPSRGRSGRSQSSFWHLFRGSRGGRGRPESRAAAAAAVRPRRRGGPP